MAERAIFGPPAAQPVEGGTFLSVHVVPVHEGRLVAFDVTTPEAEGRWLPWAILDHGGNPYETASALIDDWCRGSTMTDLRLVDVISRPTPGSAWELAIVFRAELTGTPGGDERRHPHACDIGDYEGLCGFGAVEIERWLGSASAQAELWQGKALLF